ncbi:MAG TPA: SWIM zinc finger family protein [Flavisolibacter sp.]|nr:SWIM zinc finger family protein [Flavisolibacter sp.]
MFSTIYNFSSLLPASQVKKGKDYFERGAVEQAYETKPGEWQAQVSGTDVYHVKIKLNEDSITATNCDCPHDDLFCKHVIAVLFFIQQEKNIRLPEESGSSLSHPAKKKATPKTASFETVLEKTTVKDLKEFVKTFAARNKEFRNLFMLRFELAAKENSLEKFRSLIKRTAATYKRHGFIDYASSIKAIQPAMDILDEAEINLDKGNYRIVFDACCAILLEVPALLLHMDDSNGLAGDCIYRSFDYLQQLSASQDAPYPLKDEVFDFALKYYGDKSFSDFGFEDQFLDVLISAAYDQNKQQKVFSLIEQQLKTAKDDYSIKRLLDGKMNLLAETGRANEAAEILNQHRYIQQYREALIQQKIAAKEYDAAQLLAEEGVQEEKRKDKWQQSMRWQAWHLQIAVLQKNIADIRRYSKELYFFRSNCKIEHYKIYRSTFSEEEWQQEYPKWIQWFMDKGRITPQEMYALADIYITEKLYEQLVRLLEINPDYTFAEYCRPHLLQNYLPELLNAYRQSLISFANNTVGRKHYVTLRKMLKDVQKINGGKELVAELVKFFIQQFKQRPAMKEELEKLIL